RCRGTSPRRRRSTHEAARRRGSRRGRPAGGHPLASWLRQVLMDQGNGHRALADRGGDALDGRVPDIAGHEHTRHAGFEREGIAIQRPAGWPRAARHEIETGEDEASLVTHNVSADPFGMRLSAYEDEQEIRRNILLTDGCSVGDG